MILSLSLDRIVENKGNIKSRYNVNNEFKNFLLVKDFIIKKYLIIIRIENRYLE